MKKGLNKIIIKAMAFVMVIVFAIEFIDVPNVAAANRDEDAFAVSSTASAEVDELVIEADDVTDMAMHLDADEIIEEAVTSGESERFALKRLVLIADELDDTYGANDIIHYDEYNEYILAFDTEKETEEAYNRLVKVYGSNNCFPDVVLEADDSLFEAEGSGDLVSYSWGAYYMGLDKLEQQYDSCNIDEMVKVAIIDSGITLGQPEFTGRVDTINSFNFVTGDYDINDTIGHGTHVAGIIAGSTPENVKLLMLKCFNSEGKTTVTIVSMAMQYAIEQQVDIINMSLGWNGEAAAAYTFLNNLILDSSAHNIVICCAAGNNKGDVIYSYPANNPEVLSVSAIDSYGNFAKGYSNFGSTIDYAAPGSGIISNGIYGYVTKSGTSMAAPHMAAAVSYIKMVYKDCSVQLVDNILSRYAVDLGDPGWDIYYGCGYVNLSTFFDDIKLAEKDPIGNVTEDFFPWQKKVFPIFGFAYDELSRTFGGGEFVNGLYNNADGMVIFSSSNPNVAVAREGGVISLTGVGECTITATLYESAKFYGRTVSYKLKVSAADLTRKTIKLSKTSYTYQGKECKPKVTIQGVPAGNYTVKYSGSNRVGTAKVTITGTKNCFGTVTISYKINLAKARLRYARKTSKGISLKWYKVKGASGYRIYRKTGNSSYKCIAKIHNVNKLTYLDKKARKGKKYKYIVKPVKGRIIGKSGNSKVVRR